MYVPQSSHSKPLGAFDHIARVLSGNEDSADCGGAITPRSCIESCNVCKSDPICDWKLCDSVPVIGGPMVEKIESYTSVFGIVKIEASEGSMSLFNPLGPAVLVDGPA